MRRSKSLVYVFGVMACIACSGCSGCREPEATSVSGDALALKAQALQAQGSPSAPNAQVPTGPRVIEIKARPYTGPDLKTESSGPTVSSSASPAPSTNQPKITSAPPPGATEEESLSKRLTDRLKESKIPFNEKNPPKIYVSNQTITEFASFYEAKGNKISRMSIPASVLIAPLLQDHPELAAKIDVKALENTTINQVVVEGTGVSAADKYIDPDTLQVVDKLFVTDMPSDLGNPNANK